MARVPMRERLRSSAFALFERHGYEATTVDDIVEASGVSRTTFFRVFPTKDDVVFPDHAAILAAMDEQLAAAGSGDPVRAVIAAARMVLQEYVADGERAQTLYELTRTVPSLRSRETAIVGSYQRSLRRFLTGRLTGDDVDLDAELIAAATVAVHNHVLRRWLRGESTDPLGEFDTVAARKVRLSSENQPPPADPDAAVVVLLDRTDLNDVLPRLRAVLGDRRD